MDSPPLPESSGAEGDREFPAGVRLVVLNLPEDEGEGLGFRLTRTLWDPYPWVREVILGARADMAGLKTGDCLLQADGKDLLGLPVGQVAGLIRGDGAGRGVSLLVWNCGVDPKDDPELLWSCGGGSRGERSRRALGGVVRALACCVCAATAPATRALVCTRSHLYCEPCWTRLERCALCREPLPAKDSPYAKNLVAEQVFEAIAAEYEIKDTIKQPTESVSAYTSPNRSPSMSPSTNRRGQYQLSMMNKKKTVQFNEKYRQTYASDPNIHRSFIENYRRTPTVSNPAKKIEIPQRGNTSDNGGKCNCQNSDVTIPKIMIVDTEQSDNVTANRQMKMGKCHDDAAGCQNKSAKLSSDTTSCQNNAGSYINVTANCQNSVEKCGNDAANCQTLIQHKIVARLRQACSLIDLNSVQTCPCPLTRSLNNISLVDHCNPSGHHSNSLDNLKTSCNSICESPPVYVLSAPPIYFLTCDHNKE